MWDQCKSWVVDRCWSAFSLDSWKKKSQLVLLVVKITFIMALIALIAVFFAFIDIHYWSKPSGAVILIPKDKIIEIQGRTYIPIKLL